ncbi:MAG: 5-(carboxyamino)imidazole ribonucleotide mutase [Candidatus Levybacteria bacterium]|nr:5-(carboxyamino)imidazole ribonucleotide mutase [Candidatus Levybacteria bacterium]
MTTPLVGIIMGSDSDLPVMQDAITILEDFSIPFEVTIVSAHRTPKRMYTYATTAKERGLQIIIAAAGGAAHLPGITASLTPLPVIGVPIKSKSLDGMDSLLSIVQMPPGIPVATMAINGAKNAGILAAKILAISDKNLMDAINAYMLNLDRTITEKSNNLERDGHKKYLAKMMKT